MSSSPPPPSESPAKCWFCESRAADPKSSERVLLKKIGDKSRSVRIPRCKTCASMHGQGAGIAIGFLVGIILAIATWIYVALWLAVVVLIVSTVVGGLLEWLLVGRQLAEAQKGIDAKSLDDIMSHPQVKQLLAEGWQTPENVKHVKKAFLKAIRKHDVAKVRDMLEETPRLAVIGNKPQEMPLFCAVSFEVLIATSYSKEDPLAIIKMLFEASSSPPYDKKDEETLLHWASRECFLEAAKYLIEVHNFDSNARNKRGETPLHLAAMARAAISDPAAERKTRLVEYLIHRGADINARDAKGETPLIKAIPNGILNWEATVLPIVQLLLAFGADVRPRSKYYDNKTAYELLLECKQDDDFKKVLALFEGGERVGICEVCGRLIFADEPYYENREWGSAAMSGGVLHYDVGRGYYHKKCAVREGYV